MASNSARGSAQLLEGLDAGFHIPFAVLFVGRIIFARGAMHVEEAVARKQAWAGAQRANPVEHSRCDRLKHIHAEYGGGSSSRHMPCVGSAKSRRVRTTSQGGLVGRALAYLPVAMAARLACAGYRPDRGTGRMGGGARAVGSRRSATSARCSHWRRPWTASTARSFAGPWTSWRSASSQFKPPSARKERHGRRQMPWS